MKKFTVPSFIGLILGIAIIWFIGGTLNKGGIALILLISIGFCNTISTLINKEKEEEKPAAAKPGKKTRALKDINKNTLSLILIAVLLSGCKTHSLQGISAGPPSGAGAGSGSGNTGDKYASRDFITNGTPKDKFGAYGYVVFTSKPDTSSETRYLKFARSYNHGLLTSKELRENGISGEELFPTFWILNNKLRNYRDYNEMVDKYNYAKGYIMATHLNKASVKGPLLVAWHKPFDYRNKKCDSDFLVLDLSDFEEKDFDQAFHIWKNGICGDYEAWVNTFQIDLFRKKMEMFCNKYGEGILSVIPFQDK